MFSIRFAIDWLDKGEAFMHRGLRWLIIVFGFGMAFGTVATYGQSGYVHAVNRIVPWADFELVTAYEEGDYSSIAISSLAGQNISAWFHHYDDDMNLLWESYWPSWGTMPQSGYYESSPGEIQ
jgi:hypothetical protein